MIRIREVFSIDQLEMLETILTSVINECIKLKNFVSVPERIQGQIDDYERIKKILVEYTVERKKMNDTKINTERLSQGKKTC
jgi:hypothetical protein